MFARSLIAAFLALSLSYAATARAEPAPADSPATATPFDTLASAGAATALPAPAATPSETSRVEAALPSVPIFLGGGEVFRVRSGRDGLDPIRRAAAIRGRIAAALSDERETSDSVRVRTTAQGFEVWLGPHFLWIATAEDLGPSRFVDSPETAERISRDVRGAIERERARRKPLRVLISSAIAVALTLGVWVVVRLILLGGRRWRRVIERTIGQRLQAIRIRDFEVLSRAHLATIVTGSIGRLDVVLAAVAIYIYLTTVLGLFPWTQSWSWLLLHFATQRLLAVIKGIASAVPGLVMIAIIVTVFRWIIRQSDRFFEAIASEEIQLPRMHPEVARPTKTLVKIFLWIVVAMLSYPHVPGSQSKSVQGMSILVGLMVSLGSTGIVGNMIAGLVLTYSRAFSVGDRVRVGDHVGDIVSLGFLSTKLRSIRNEEVTIPNGLVTGGGIVNYTRLAADAGLILYTEVTIGYDVEWRKVHALLVEAASRVAGVEAKPKPWVNQRSLNDSHISYELNCVTRDSHAQLRLYSDLHAEIQDAFNRAGVEILSPGYHAIRDANSPVLPEEPAGPRAKPGGFRIRS